MGLIVIKHASVDLVVKKKRGKTKKQKKKNEQSNDVTR